MCFFRVARLKVWKHPKAFIANNSLEKHKILCHILLCFLNLFLLCAHLNVCVYALAL